MTTVPLLGTPLTSKGDLPVADATGKAKRVPVGSDGQVLTADSTQPEGVKWGAAGGVTTLAADSDVAIAAPSNNQALLYDSASGKWKNVSLTAALVGARAASDDLSAIAAANQTATNWSNNSKKITNLANGTAASDAAAFGQIPTSLPPNGTAGGMLSGSYPNPLVRRRVVTVTQSATPAINTDTTDVASITGLAQAITSMTTNLTGTPVDGQTLVVRITDNGTARAITWGASFESSTVALPTTTVISTLLIVGFVWNTVTSKWRCLAVA